MSHYKNEIFHVQITPEFLFDVNKKFKSEFTPWIYLYLRLQHNLYITKKPNYYYKINLNDITMQFNIHKATTYKVINELIACGLIERNGRKYKILDETKLTTKNENIFEDEKFIDFIRIFNNDFKDILMSLKVNWGDPIICNEMILKSLRVYYYLIYKSAHCVIDKFEHDSNETQTSISKNLNHDNRTIKDILNVLHNAGYLIIQDDLSLVTINKRFENSKPEFVEKNGEHLKDKVNFFSTYDEVDYSDENENEIEWSDSSITNQNFRQNYYSMPVPAV